MIREDRASDIRHIPLSGWLFNELGHRDVNRPELKKLYGFFLSVISEMNTLLFYYITIEWILMMIIKEVKWLSYFFNPTLWSSLAHKEL